MNPPEDNRCGDFGGFTLIELLVVVAVLGVIMGIAVPQVMRSIRKARYASASQEIRSYSRKIILHKTRNGSYPSKWSDIGKSSVPTDPWGNDYVFNNHQNTPKGKWRKDKGSGPINDDFDLVSPGPDGKTNTNIDHKHARDDVMYAKEGSFIGKADNY